VLTLIAQAFNYARASRHTVGRQVWRSSILTLCLGTLVPKHKEYLHGKIIALGTKCSSATLLLSFSSKR